MTGAPGAAEHVAVQGWAAAEGIWLQDQLGGFQLWGDMQPDGGFMGTLDAAGSSGSFHLRPFANALPGDFPTDPTWLSGQWARLHSDWNSMNILRVRRTPELQEETHNVAFVFQFQDMDVYERAELRFRVLLFAADYKETEQEFWRLAPGEVRRFGGEDCEGFVVHRYDGLQTLVLDAPFSSSPTATISVTEVDVDEKGETPAESTSKTNELHGPFLLPLRFRTPSIFPQALIGPWLRGGLLIEIDSNFLCREADEEMQLQVFPEVIYPRWGGWILNVSRSNALVLEWGLSMNPEYESPRRMIRWMRPWLFKGMIEVLSAGSEEVNGVYTPDFTGTVIKYTKKDGKVELLNVNGKWEFAKCTDLNTHQIYYSFESPMPAVGQWDASSVVPPATGLGTLPAPLVRLWLGESRLAEEAQQAIPFNDELRVDRLRFNVLPRFVSQDASSCTFVVSQGIIEQFSGDAILVVGDVSDSDMSASNFSNNLEPMKPMKLVGGYYLKMLPGLRATWSVLVTPDGGELNQPEVSVAPDLQEAIRQACELVISEGAVSIGVSHHPAVESSGSKSLEAIISAVVNAFLGLESEKSEKEQLVNKPQAGQSSKASKVHTGRGDGQKPRLEVYFPVDVAEIVRARKAVEKSLAKQSDASFLNAMKAGAGSRPAWLNDSLRMLRKSAGSATAKWRKQLREDPAMRGVLVAQFSKLAEVVAEVLNREWVLDEGPYAADPGSPLSWFKVNMYHICQHFIIPLTSEHACSYVELVASDLQPPEWMVSHAWSTHFAATAEMLKQHALSRKPQESMEMSYWCCTLANNQHDLSSLQEVDLLKTPFARVLVSVGCFGTVILCDSEVTPLRRVWCVFEAHLTQRLRSREDDLSSKSTHFLDLVAFDESAGSPKPYAPESVAILQDGVKGWNEVAAGQAHFPLEVARVGTSVDIRLAEASLQSDRHAIMNFIAYGAMTLKTSSNPPPVKHVAYDKLNEFVHSAFASAELYRLACERPEGCVERAKELLSLGADPNSFVREGRFCEHFFT
eukprot:g31978.t1